MVDGNSLYLPRVCQIVNQGPLGDILSYPLLRSIRCIAGNIYSSQAMSQDIILEACLIIYAFLRSPSRSNRRETESVELEWLFEHRSRERRSNPGQAKVERKYQA
jgi:hypothetical protein